MKISSDLAIIHIGIVRLTCGLLSWSRINTGNSEFHLTCYIRNIILPLIHTTSCKKF